MPFTPPSLTFSSADSTGPTQQTSGATTVYFGDAGMTTGTVVAIAVAVAVVAALLLRRKG